MGMNTACLFQRVRTWRAIAKTLVGFGRALVRLDKTHSAKAWPAAQQAEVVCRAALAEFTAEITEIIARDAPRTEDEDAALDRLWVLGGVLMALVLFTRKICAGLAGRRPAGFASAGRYNSQAGQMRFRVYAAPNALPAYLDSS